MNPPMVVSLLANAYRGNSEIEQQQATQRLAPCGAAAQRGGNKYIATTACKMAPAHRIESFSLIRVLSSRRNFNHFHIR
jgi:hypothetical protein